MRAQDVRVGVFAALLSAGMAVMAMPTIAVAGPTLDAVKARGELVCGVHTGLYGFGAPDDKGVWRGIDVDVCRAVAAAVFGDDKKVKYVPLSAQARLTALQSGEIDLLSRNTTWTLDPRHRQRPELHRRQLLRRPGLHGGEEAGRQQRQGAVRRDRLRADRHHDRAQPRRLLPRQQDGAQAGHHREVRGGDRRPSSPAAATPSPPTPRSSPPSAPTTRRTRPTTSSCRS